MTLALARLDAGWRPVRMEVTAYCPCKLCCGPDARGITANGRPARGRMIAAPSEYPFGTEMIVPGYGFAQVCDRGGAIRSRGDRWQGRTLQYDHIDLLMPTHHRALEWGRRILIVLVKD
jgi:3D (Asp-Asp-Asp) domain-containing protein